MNHRPMVRTDSNDPKFYGNALVFATKEEAQYSADALARRWFLVVETGTEETEAPVNYKIDITTGEMSAVPT